MSALLSSRFTVALFAFFSACSYPLSARTLLEAGAGAEHDPAGSQKAVSQRYLRQFDAAGLKADERLVILVTASDGEIVYLNGKELGRVNMPDGAVTAQTLALAAGDTKKKGLFVRLMAPAEAVKSNEKNVIETEVHSAQAEGSLLSFNLEVKTLPPDQPMPPPDSKAKEVLETFRRTSYLSPGTPIPDGYFDGGRRMALDAEDHARSGREILLVDRPHDPELAKDLEYARSLRDLPPLVRAHKLVLYIDGGMTPPGGLKLLDPIMAELEHEYVNKPLHLGDVKDQYHAGVCRHRSLLFKVLADEAGLKTALVRGNYVHIHAGGSGAHVWNEVQLEDGRRYLVDAMLRPKSEFVEISSDSVTTTEIARRYVKGDGSPYYRSDAR